MTIRLEARTPRIPNHPWRFEAEGSSLTWEEAPRKLTYVPPTRQPETGWSVLVGEEPGQVARVVRVRGSLPHDMTGFAVESLEVDHFTFLSSDGTVLTPGLATGLDASFRGWCPPASVRALTDASGLAYSEDTVTDWADLLTRYPGLVPRARSLSRSATVSAITMTAFGVFFLALGLALIPIAVTGDGLEIVLVLAMVIPTGLYLVWTGLHFSYRFTRRLARRRAVTTARARADDNGR